MLFREEATTTCTEEATTNAAANLQYVMRRFFLIVFRVVNLYLVIM